MGLLDAIGDGLAQGAQSVADQTAAQIAADRELAVKTTLAQNEANINKNMADQARTEMVGRINAAKGGIIKRNMLEQAQGEYSDQNDDGTKSPVTLDDVSDDDLARYKHAAENDPGLIQQAGEATGDIKPGESATLNQRDQAALARANSLIDRANIMLSAHQGDDATKLAIAQLNSQFKSSDRLTRQLGMMSLDNNIKTAQQDISNMRQQMTLATDTKVQQSYSDQIKEQQGRIAHWQDLQDKFSGMEGEGYSQRVPAPKSTDAPTGKVMQYNPATGKVE